MAYFSLGETYRKQGNKSVAIESCQQSLEKDPHNNDAADTELEASAAAAK